MSAAGAGTYNPVTGLPSVVDTNELTFVSTTLSGSVSSGSSTIVVASATGLNVDQYIQLGPQGSGAEIVQITGITSNTLTLFPSTGKNHSNGDPVVAKVERQVTTLGSATNATYYAAIQQNGSLLMASGTARTILTSSSATAATNIKSVPGTLVSFWNTGPALTVYLQLYDSATTTISQATCIYGDGTSATALGAGQIITLNCWLVNGLTYTLSGALPSTANIIILTA